MYTICIKRIKDSGGSPIEKMYFASHDVHSGIASWTAYLQGSEKFSTVEEAKRWIDYARRCTTSGDLREDSDYDWDTLQICQVDIRLITKEFVKV